MILFLCEVRRGGQAGEERRGYTNALDDDWQNLKQHADGREFVRRVRSPVVRKANPKMKVDVRLVEEYGTATISLEYGKMARRCVRCVGGGRHVQR